MEEANYLLGYSYFLTGPVLHGNEIGRTIGIPTANQRPETFKLLPPKGVYAVKVLAEGKQYDGKTDIRNPLSLLAHERSRFATCVQTLHFLQNL